MLRNYKHEEKLKEMGVKDPKNFMRYQMLENKNILTSSIIITFYNNVYN